MIETDTHIKSIFSIQYTSLLYQNLIHITNKIIWSHQIQLLQTQF